MRWKPLTKLNNFLFHNETITKTKGVPKISAKKQRAIDNAERNKK